MQCKTFEIRDRGTFIPALAVRLHPSCERDRYLFGRAGFGPDDSTQGEYVALWQLDGGDAQCTSDPYGHNGSQRTFATAHNYIIAHWDELPSGAVVDVQFILGEASQPKRSEQEG